MVIDPSLMVVSRLTGWSMRIRWIKLIDKKGKERIGHDGMGPQRYLQDSQQVS